jgi:hypothetical protein
MIPPPEKGIYFVKQGSSVIILSLLGNVNGIIGCFRRVESWQGWLQKLLPTRIINIPHGDAHVDTIVGTGLWPSYVIKTWPSVLTTLDLEQL